MINLRVWQNFLVPISVTLSQGHQTTEVGQILTGTHDKVRASHPIATKLLRYTPLVKISTWLNSGGIISVTFSNNLFHKISNAFFPYRTFYLSYLRNGWCETKRKWVNWMLHWLGYLWPWPLILNFQCQIVSWEWDFKVTSGICYISAKNGSIATKKRQTYWLNARPQMGSWHSNSNSNNLYQSGTKPNLFCNISNVFKNMFNVGLIIMW